MKYVVLEDKGKKEKAVREAFSKKKLDVIFCSTSNDFMTAVSASKFDIAVINAKAWGKGRAIYNYFGAGKNMEDKQVVFYNANEQFIPAIKYRKHSPTDVVHFEPSDIETVVNAL